MSCTLGRARDATAEELKTDERDSEVRMIKPERSSVRARMPTVFCVFAMLFFAGCASVQADRDAQATPKNIIILYGDGAAGTQWELGRYTSRALRKKSFAITDVVFKEGSLGLLATYSADSFVTDSAAAGTALSTGYKTNNGMVGMTPSGDPVRTAMEVAKARGKRIGLVTTAEIYDASPAAFSVHAKSRRRSTSRT